MGGSSSKGQVLNPHAQAQPQQPQGPPYAGPPLEYSFVNTQVSMNVQASFTFNNMVTTNIDSYYPILGQKYAEGFRMLTFYRIPAAARREGLFSMSINVPFQGVFARSPEMRPHEGWQLRVVKSLMVAQRMGHGLIQMNPGIVGDTSHIYQAIVDNTNTGGRLICVEMTGQQQSQGFSRALAGVTPVMGVDLFFEVPANPLSERYVYQCIPVPVILQTRMGFGTPNVTAQCDWNGVLASQLSQGWKLVEVFFDMGQHRHGAFSTKATLNSVWFFEKPASRMNDNTPVYQGTVVEHYVHVSSGFSGARTSTNWESLVQQMGNQGWELACFVETPEYRVTGFGAAEMKIMIIFQRKLLPPPGGGYAMPPPGNLYPPNPPMHEQPPPYNG